MLEKAAQCGYNRNTNVLAWGNLLRVTGSLANTLGADNPLRYRGYVYDTQTRLYYLQSRYYDPEVGRFINADALVSTGQGLLGNNMFAYCRNNPANCCDPEGTASMVCFGFESSIILPTQDPTTGGELSSAVVTLAAMAIVAYAIEKRYEKESTIVFADAYITQSHNSAVFFGADMRGGSWKIVTKGMSFEEAKAWVLLMACTGGYGRGASWGLYTSEQADAWAMIVTLGGPEPCRHENRPGEYPHFHPRMRTLFEQYKHFHVWYGSIYGG